MKFGYTILYVADVERAIAFYEAAFGIERNFIHASDYGELKTGETKLAFATIELAKSNGVEFASASRQTAAPAMEVGFVTEDVAKAFAKAVNAGAER